MRFEALVSCMNQNDTSIVDKSKIDSDVLIVNQCYTNEYIEFTTDNNKKVRMISTTQRGLSRSRNMAIVNSKADICLICDDDEIFEVNYEQKILNAFENNKDADVIIFKLNHPTRKYKDYSYTIDFFKSGQIGSVQIAFRRSKIIDKNIKFDEMMGSGTGNGDGEENKFIVDCLKAKLNIIYLPVKIATLLPNNESQWFKGYTKEYFLNKGWSLRRIYGTFFSYLIIWRFLIRKYSIYKKELTFMQACRSIHKGFILKRK